MVVVELLVVMLFILRLDLGTFDQPMLLVEHAMAMYDLSTIAICACNGGSDDAGNKVHDGNTNARMA